LSGWLLLIIAVFIAFLCARRYELAVFLVILSPWISAIQFADVTGDSAFQDEANLGPYIRLSILFITGIVGTMKYLHYKFIKRCIIRERLSFQTKLLGIFILMALFSTTYSIDPFYTFIRSISFLTFWGFLLGLHVWLNDNARLYQTLNILFYFVCMVAAANIIALLTLGNAVWLKEEGIRFLGLWGHPNTLGSFCMLSYFIALWKYSQSEGNTKKIILLLLALLFILHILTGSRSTLLVSILGFSYWLLILRKRVTLILFIAAISLVGVMLITSKDVLTSFQRETTSGKSLTTLSGRLDFWNASRVLISEKPILGYGYGVSGKVLSDRRYWDPKLSLWRGSVKTSLHNGFIEILIGMGFLGFIVWIVVVYISLKQCLLHTRSTYKAFIMTIILMSLLLNFVESSLSGTQVFTGIIFWIVWFLSDKIIYVNTIEAKCSQKY
jgi:O-antigen ligase